MHIQNNYKNSVKEMDTIFEAKLMKINVGEKIGELLRTAKDRRIEFKDN